METSNCQMEQRPGKIAMKCGNCTRDARPGRKYCETCAANMARYMRERTELHKQLGLCLRCGRPARENRSTCAACEAKASKKRKARYRKAHPKRQCRMCGRKVAKYRIAYCSDACQVKGKMKDDRRREACHVAIGMCMTCGSPREPHGTSRRCRSCADKYAGYQRASYHAKRQKAQDSNAD